MAKYIDADKLRAEIERRIASWANREKYALPGQGKDTCQSRVTELTDLLSFIDSLKPEQTSLPSNLDEAAEKYGDEYAILPDDYNDGEIDFYAEETGKAFKAGAEWMARQMKQEQSEVDLDIISYELPPMSDDENLGLCVCDHFGNHRMSIKDVQEIARHFYELGLKAKEESK